MSTTANETGRAAIRSRSSVPVPPEAFEDIGGLPDGAGVALVMPFVVIFWAAVLVWLRG